MKPYFLLFNTIFLSLASCGNPSKEVETTQENIETTIIFGEEGFVFSNLSENAKNYGMQWGAFEDFEEQAKTINGNNLEAIQTKSILMVSHIDSLIKKIPDTLNTPLIFSRVIVVKTRTQLLNLEINKVHFDSVRLQDYFKEMNISVRNLFIQINEKFEKDAIDLQRIDSETKELALQKEFLDAVYKAELEDQNKK